MHDSQRTDTFTYEDISCKVKHKCQRNDSSTYEDMRCNIMYEVYKQPFSHIKTLAVKLCMKVN
jgi:hypothetical protein